MGAVGLACACGCGALANPRRKFIKVHNAVKHWFCTVAGCGLPHAGKGFCKRHYEELYWRAGRCKECGTPILSTSTFCNGCLKLGARHHQWIEAPDEIFWDSIAIADEQDCWLWEGDPWRGYGRFQAHKKNWKASRYAYQSAIGPIPPGAVVHHVCFTKLCCNPRHLQALTPSEHSRLHRRLELEQRG